MAMLNNQRVIYLWVHMDNYGLIFIYIYTNIRYIPYIKQHQASAAVAALLSAVAAPWRIRALVMFRFQWEEHLSQLVYIIYIYTTAICI
jgi:hypothetical protein